MYICCGKAISITYSEFVFVALVIQQAMRMRRIILSSVGCLIVPYFPTLSYTARFSGGKKITEHKIRVLIYSTNFV